MVEDGKVRLPFTAIRGLGDAAAVALEQATMHGQEYISVEELQQASGVAQSVLTSSAPSALWAVCPKRARWICSV
ncbi:hypothetical protein NIA69_13060 [Gemmiger formicilis]|nr:hypothetical protein [Gemmiger formicilis]